MIKSWLMMIGIVLVLFGIFGLIPSVNWFGDQKWIGWAEIVFGTIIVMTSNRKQE